MSDEIGLVRAQAITYEKVSSKTQHLITLCQPKNKLFLTLDKPDTLVPGWITVKGLFLTPKDKDVETNFTAILQSSSKDRFIELTIPSANVIYIRNLIYKAK